MVYRCGAGEPVLASLDTATATGAVRWSLVQGQDFDGDYEYHDAPEEVTFAPVGDVAVLQNMASLRGTVVIGTEGGGVLSDSLPS